MKNNFGNYVIQKALKISRGDSKIKLIDIAYKNIEKIGEKRIMERWREIIIVTKNGGEYNLPSYNKKSKITQGCSQKQISNFNFVNNNNNQQNFDKKALAKKSNSLVQTPIENYTINEDNDEGNDFKEPLYIHQSQFRNKPKEKKFGKQSLKFLDTQQGNEIFLSILEINFNPNEEIIKNVKDKDK